jgi:hypothetical protein
MELVEERINGTYDEENIDPNKQSLCRWEVDLTGVTLKKIRQMACATHC